MRKPAYSSLMFGVALLGCWTMLNRAPGQVQSDLLVIDGGTLVDGNGGPVARDVQIVVRGNRIDKIGKKGEAIPAGSQIIRGDGKFIVPGFWDAQLNFYSFQGEAMLNTGVTSFLGIGDNGEAGVLMHEGVLKGRIVSPRPFDGAVHFQANDFAGLEGLDSPYHQGHAVKTAEQAREWTRKLIALGADQIALFDSRSEEVVRAVAEEAHKAGVVTAIRPAGPDVFARKAAELGVDIDQHSMGIAVDVANAKMPPLPPPANFQVKPGDLMVFPDNLFPPDELELWSYMDDAKVPAEIKYLVEHHMNLVPTFIQTSMGLPKGWDRFEAEDRLLLGNEALQAYYPEERRLALLSNYANPVHTRPRVRERHEQGFRNALRFHKMFVEAGGRVLVGTDGGNAAVPGPAVHHEMEILAEDGGFTPMQVLQAATKWPAEAVKHGRELGTIEVGKLADIVILKADPLESVQNLKAISNVIFNGKALDGKYHPFYNASNPFGGAGFDGLPPVEDLQFTTVVRKANYREGRAQGVAPGRLPQPGIEKIDTQRKDFEDSDFSRVAIREGGPTLHLKIQGFNFFDRSQLFFDDKPIPFEVKSLTEIDALIDEAWLRKPGRYSIRVKNPPPAANMNWGNGISNAAWLLVSYKDSLRAASPLRTSR